MVYLRVFPLLWNFLCICYFLQFSNLSISTIKKVNRIIRAFIRSGYLHPVAFVNCLLPLSLKCGMPLPSWSCCTFRKLFCSHPNCWPCRKAGALNPDHLSCGAKNVRLSFSGEGVLFHFQATLIRRPRKIWVNLNIISASAQQPEGQLTNETIKPMLTSIHWQKWFMIQRTLSH